MNWETILQVVITLFALAMISERIVEFLKKVLLPLIGRMFFSQKGGVINPGFFGLLAAFNTRQVNVPDFEEKREQLIIPLSVLVGIGVAGLSWDWFEPFLKGQNLKIHPLAGIFLVGILFSFGSKFWHDLLDLLFAIKNIRRNLSATNPGDLPGAKEWQAYLTMDEKALAEAVVQEEKNKLMTQYSSALVELSPLLVRDPRSSGGYKYVIAAYFRDKRPSGFPDYFRAPGANVWIGVKTIEDIGLPKAQRSPGYMVRNTNSFRHGSFGCIIQLEDSKKYMLTCAHVLVDEPGITNEQQVITQTRVWVGGTGEVLPVFQYHLGGAIGLDYALIGPVDERYSNEIATGASLQDSRSISAVDEGGIVTISVARHAMVIEKSSVLKNCCLPEQKIVFQDGSIQLLKHLIRIERITQEGDSGSIVYDDQGSVLGMVVAADDHFTYLLSIVAIFGEIKHGAKIMQPINI